MTTQEFHDKLLATLDGLPKPDSITLNAANQFDVRWGGFGMWVPCNLIVEPDETFWERTRRVAEEFSVYALRYR